MKVKCPKCKYEWETKSKLIYITCVSCQRKFEKEKNEKNSIKGIQNESTRT